MVFLKLENKEVQIVKARVIIYVHKCFWHGRGTIEIAHPREGNRKRV